LLLFLNSIVLANAVRNAVISLALISPRTVPFLFSSVRLPVGLVACPFIRISFTSCVRSGGTSKAVVWLLVLVAAVADPDPRDKELIRGPTLEGSLLVLPSCVLLAPLGLPESALEKLPTRSSKFGRLGGSALLAHFSLSVTIFTPMLSMVLAGMNSVVDPSLSESCVRFGW
jgi:hypothetical protein